MLDIQYRMHPDLSRFPAREFYGHSLLDGTVGRAELRPPASRYLERGADGPGVAFLDHRHGEARRDRSRVNVGEGRIVCEVVADLLLLRRQQRLAHFAQTPQTGEGRRLRRDDDVRGRDETTDLRPATSMLAVVRISSVSAAGPGLAHLAGSPKDADRAETTEMRPASEVLALVSSAGYAA